MHSSGLQGQGHELVAGRRHPLRNLLTQPSMNDVGVDAMGQGYASNGGSSDLALRHDLTLEFWAVVTPLGTLGDRLARHGVHDLHRAHDACSTRLSQDGITGRLRSWRDCAVCSCGTARNWRAYNVGAELFLPLKSETSSPGGATREPEKFSGARLGHLPTPERKLSRERTHVWDNAVETTGSHILSCGCRDLQALAVASRTIIRTLVKQMRVRLVPFFHGLHRRLALQG